MAKKRTKADTEHMFNAIGRCTFPLSTSTKFAQHPRDPSIDFGGCGIWNGPLKADASLRPASDGVKTRFEDDKIRVAKTPHPR